MTNEEAIAIIENEKKCVNRANKNDYCNRDCYNCELVKTDTEILTALDLAIKALEQQPITTTNNDEPITVIYPTTVCNDAISREAVIEILENYGCTNREGLIFKDIRALPPVTLQQKYGKWIENAPEYQNIDPPYICSVCGNMHLRKTNYCDQCGCRMYEPQKG